jgi:hypothetical protein
MSELLTVAEMNGHVSMGVKVMEERLQEQKKALEVEM